jgi:ribosomal protein S18 acetylase RimI-like enzyme
MDAIRSLGFRTDIMLLALQGSSIEEHDGYRVVRTPSNPSYHWGNFLLIDRDPHPGDMTGWVRTFEREFPGVPHIAIGIDGTEPSAISTAEFEAAGVTPDAATALTATDIRLPERPNTEAEFRMLRADSDPDWDAALAVQWASYPPTDEDDGEYARHKLAALRELQVRGKGGWFGAFLDGRMVAGLGVFSDGSGVARYQTVDTHPDFRRRGLAGMLVYTAARHAVDELGATTLVIVADPDYTAINLYKALGFVGTETQMQLEKLKPRA